jgi:uncharacterized cysteine cluster protein YcgN (CxxCxxCC family)
MSGHAHALRDKSPTMTEAFWREKTMAEMSREEWESLCDGCGRCCLLKLEEPDDNSILFTDVACKLLDCHSCRCGDYANRKAKVPDCVILEPATVADLNFMPSTCAYRLLAEGKDLPDWHPLVSGDPDSVHRAGISVQDKVYPEAAVPDEDLEDHIVTWPA